MKAINYLYNKNILKLYIATKSHCLYLSMPKIKIKIGKTKEYLTKTSHIVNTNQKIINKSKRLKILKQTFLTI